MADFVLTSVQDAARLAIEAHQRIDLSVRDSEAFVDALLKPQPASARLKDTIQRYRQASGVQQLDAPLRVETLAAHHDRSRFKSGVEALDRYFQLQAGQDARKNMAALSLSSSRMA